MKLNQIKTINQKNGQTPKSILHDEDIIITGVHIGRTKLTQSRLICKEPKPMCEICHYVLSLNHIFLECPTYQYARIRLNINTTSSKKSFNPGQETKILDFNIPTQFLHYNNYCKIYLKLS